MILYYVNASDKIYQGSGLMSHEAAGPFYRYGL